MAENNGIRRDQNGRLAKGTNKVPGAGRKKGSKNKVPADIRQIYEDVFHEIGGLKTFAEWARKTDHNKGIYYQMLSKLLPRTIEGKLGGDITVIVKSAIPRPPKKAPSKGGAKTGAKK